MTVRGPVLTIPLTHIIAGLAIEDGGPSYSVPALASALARLGAAVRLRSLDDPGWDDRVFEGLERCMHSSSLGPIGQVLRASSELKKAVMADARAGAILHAHGLWLMPNIYPAEAKRHSGGSTLLVHSPRGMLGKAALKISAWKKRPFWWFAQRSALAYADCIHATAGSEYEEIRAVGLKNPVAIVPNGVDLPDLGRFSRPRGDDRIVLSLGRIHPKKGLDRLARAWAWVENEFPSWRLRIVGPSELGHDSDLRSMAKELGLKRISVEGPIYGKAKLAAYRSADLFVLPTLNENFGMTVAESLAAGTPVIATKGAPWAKLETERCGWWIDQGVEPLAAALQVAMARPRGDLHAMGARGRTWMARDFCWDRIACDMLDVYRWLHAGGEPPATVLLD